MRLAPRLLFIFVIALVSVLYIFPWEKYNITLPEIFSQYIKPYKYGLDLHGGVELDYKVDLSAVKSQSGNQISESSIIETLKGIVDKRVSSLGLEEPTISTAQYGPGESHIIVQIPVKDYGNITEDEKRAKNAEDIARAKETIGKVVQIEFREEKKGITEADKKARKDLAEKALLETKDTPFTTVGTKYRDQYENVGYVFTGGALIPQAKFDGIDAINKFPYISPVHYVAGEETIGADEKGNPTTTRGPGGYAITYLESMQEVEVPAVGTGAATKAKTYTYGLIYIDERPSLWAVAQTADGKSLSDKYLTRAGVSFTQAGVPQVELIFNDEGKRIF